MLKGINKIISPELLSDLHKMGHGDEIIFADANFPAYQFSKNVIRADGSSVLEFIYALQPLFELDMYVPDNVVAMSAVSGDTLDKALLNSYNNALQLYDNYKNITYIDRFDFYERSKNAFCICMTGTTEKYANLILKKGVTSA